MPDKTAGRPVARPKVRLAPRVVARERQILPMAEVADAREIGNDRTMEIRRRRDAGILAESFAINDQQNFVRPALENGQGVLRSARGWLKELRDNAPPLYLSFPAKMAPIGNLNATLRDASAWVKELRKNAPPSIWRVPRKRGKMDPNLILDIISGSIDVTQQVTNRLDADAHAKLVANQIKIVSELEKKVEALEKLDRELEAQKGDKARERKALPPEK